MALTQTWVLQGTSPTTIEATDSLAFSNGTFGNPIQVGAYNGGTHVRSNAGADDSSGNSPHNSKYLTSSTVSLNGAGSASLSTISTTNSPLKITIAESVNITVSDISLYAYDGTTTTVAPTDLNVQLAQQGDSTWTLAHGSASALTLDDSTTPATSHDFFVLVSVSPTTIGVKSANKIRIEFTYQ